MSKEFAQTVGGKRFAWLLALLAVFVLVAGSQLLPSAASAAGTGDGTLSGPLDQQGENTLAPSPNRPDVLLPGLYHVDPLGEISTDYFTSDGTYDYFVALPRDVENNLIGWEHEVCLVSDDGTYTEVENEEIELDLLPGGDGGIAPINPSQNQFNWRIEPLSQPAGGTANIVGATKQALFFDDYENGDGIGEDGLPCVRWWSSGPGEQNITAISETGTVAADWSDGTDQIITGGPFDPELDEIEGFDEPNADVCNFFIEEQVPQVNGGETQDCDEGLSPSDPLVKEWNVLDRTEIKRAGPRLTATGPNLDGQTVIVPAIFNPATSRFKALQNTGFVEEVYGEHITSGGATLNPIVVGAKVTFTAGGSCGYTVVDGTITPPFVPVSTGTTLEGNPLPSSAAGRIIYPPSDGDPSTPSSVTVTSIGVGIYFEVGTEDCIILDDMTHTVTISVEYPRDMGSQQPPVPADEIITVKWVSQLSQKKVLLAWAGQRIVLEHDWRIPPGGLDQPGWAADRDVPPDGNDDEAFEAGLGNLARCPWTFAGVPVVFVSKFLKQAGDGTFLSNNELGPLTAIGDLLFDLISPDEINNITFATSCVSRAVYESNPPGQVDITLQVTDVCFDIDIDGGPRDDVDQATLDQIGNIPAAFDCVLEGIDPLNQSKVDFVIYYMKFEDVRLSVVPTVAKPTHNASAAAWADYAPGNPWDASTDVTSHSDNVSKDILVRGRVRGWFENENPSGRARDDSDPLNVRPQDRWVLPDDWAILAGGPADPADGSDLKGTAEEFRPYYDLMIAPNNVSGLALATPIGGGAVLVASVVAPATGANSGSAFAVSSVANIQAGSFISVPSVGTSDGPGVCVTPGVSKVLSVTGNVVTLDVALDGAGALCATPAVGAGVLLISGPFEGPLSLIDVPGFNVSAAPSSVAPGSTRDTTFPDGDVDMWDAPMPFAPVSVKIRGAGFIKEVLKKDVYYLGNPNVAAQVFPNPYYIGNIPSEPWISAISAGGGYVWDSWGLDGPGGKGKGAYEFWEFVKVGQNPSGGNIIGVGDALTAAEVTELNAIRAEYGDASISRDTVVFSDNHGEFMVTANGDFKLDYSECATNAISGGKHCKVGDKVGSSTIEATVDYPEFRGKHPPVKSNPVTIDWTWGGYKDVTIEDGETPQFKYLVFHALDRDGFCYFNKAVGTRSLHPVLSELDDDATIGAKDPVESVDFLIDAGEGIITDASIPAGTTLGDFLNVDGNRQFVTGLPTFSTARNTTLKEFDFSPSASAEQTDECQAWIKVSNSLLGIVNFLVVAHDDEGDIGFDRIIDLQDTATYTLNFRWSLITWNGADNIPVTDALRGTGANDAGNDIFDQVTAVYGWEQSSQDWLGFFPSGVDVPGANDLTALRQGSAYWIAIKAPGPVTWTYATNVD